MPVADEADLPVARGYRDAVARLGEIRTESRWLNAVSVRIPLDRIEEVAALPFVAEVRPVLSSRTTELFAEGPGIAELEPAERGSDAAAPESDPYGPSRAQLEAIGVPEAHAAGYTGGGVAILIIDTGFRKDHVAFRGVRILAERDFLFGDGDVQNEPVDGANQQDHGTAVWSACGGHAPGELIGPAYGASYLLAKTELPDVERRTEEDAFIAALEWGDSLGADISTASLVFKTFEDGSGYDYRDLDGDTTPVSRAVDRATRRGIISLNGVGNDGPNPGTLACPADADSVIACGAIDFAGRITSFSSRGPTIDGRIKPEVVAPGLDVFVAIPRDQHAYNRLSGTSLSTPLIAGVCALVMESHPDWSPWVVKSIVQSTADRAGSPDNTYGYGTVNAWAAMRLHTIVAPRPFGLLAPADGDTIDQVGATLRWGRSADPQGERILYEVWIDEDEAFSSPRIIPTIADTSLTIVDPLASGSRVFWKVIARASDLHSRQSRDVWTLLTRTAPDPGIEEWALWAAPNPWRPGGPNAFRIQAPAIAPPQEVELRLLDVGGRLVASRTLRIDHGGLIDLPWEIRSNKGNILPSGIYFARLAVAGVELRTQVAIVR